jgi:hypothetical protein
MVNTSSFPLKFTLMIAFLSSLLASCKKETYESPDYHVVKSEGAFEIRNYPESSMVTTPMQQRGADGSFMRLFRFISGKNDQHEKISMTVPVIMSGPKSGTMSFVVPKKIALTGVPRPTDPSIKITTMPEGNYATYRFSGRAGALQNESAAKKLSVWLNELHLDAAGAPMFASYNPPWTPGFMRRNEVLIRLAGHISTSP